MDCITGSRWTAVSAYIRISMEALPACRPVTAATGSEEIGGHVQDRGRGSFHDPFCEKPAIRLSRKDWHFGASRAVVWLGSTRRHGLVPGSCPAGFVASAGLRRGRRDTPPRNQLRITMQLTHTQLVP